MDIIYLFQKEAFRRNFSNKTIISYSACIRSFLKFCSKEPRKVTKKDMKDYLGYLSSSGKSASTQNIHHAALKFVIKEILFKNWNLNFHLAKRPKSLPVVLTKKEMTDLIGAIDNKKHKLMVCLAYGAGLRVSELICLKTSNMEESYGWVRHGKGNKDRLFIIPEKLRKDLKSLIESLSSESFLFKGNKNNHYSREAFYSIVKRYAKKAGIKKNVHPHTLRHSFATHLVEEGNDLLLIQQLMGHNRLETTRGYIHLAMPKINVKSPLDTLY